jgi:hypothetical protein
VGHDHKFITGDFGDLIHTLPSFAACRRIPESAAVSNLARLLVSVTAVARTNTVLLKMVREAAR